MASVIKLLNVKNINMVIRNVARVGLITTLRYVFSDLFFDLRYGVETINTKMLDELEINSPNKAHGRYYEGTNAHIFKQAFSFLKIDVRGSCFVDFGSGKGKAMFLAAEKGFRKVIGVEFSAELVEICKKNLEVFKRRTKTRTEFEVYCLDAAEYEIPAEADLLFFSNPFDETLIEKVIVNILRSMDAAPRDLLVMHLYPQGNRAFADHPRFLLEHEWKDGYLFRVGRR